MPARSRPISCFRVADLPQNRPTRFELRPDPTWLDGLTNELGLLGLRKVSLVGDITARGKTDWTLHARLGATVVQPCVVTLAPVTTRIDTDIVRHFMATMPELGDEEEIEMPEDENAEQLGAQIDVALVMTEALALHLPLYPRAKGAEIFKTAFTEPGIQAMTDEDARPFAGLAALRDKLGDKDEK